MHKHEEEPNNNDNEGFVESVISQDVEKESFKEGGEFLRRDFFFFFFFFFFLVLLLLLINCFTSEK